MDEKGKEIGEGTWGKRRDRKIGGIGNGGIGTRGIGTGGW